MAYDLQKESDVKEYIEKLGIEYRFGCYSEKNPEVCHLLGDYLESIRKDFEKASKVFKSNCDDYGYAKSCYKYGNYSFLGKGKSGSKGDPQQAYKYYEKGCELKDADSCLHSGLLLISKAMPKQIVRNIPKGVEFLTKSCDMNNGTACFHLSGMHISGVQKQPDITVGTTAASNSVSTSGSDRNDLNVEFIIQRDMKKAFDFAYKACELKNMYACANLSQMYARGDGTDPNPENAEKFKKMAVEMQEDLKKQQATIGFQQGILQH